jgi:hypothetical protein
MDTLLAIAIVLAAAATMEFVAWASHKYIMHGFGWAWHRDHHEPHDGFLKRTTSTPWSARRSRSRCSRSAARW